MCVRDDDALQGGIWLHQPRDGGRSRLFAFDREEGCSQGKHKAVAAPALDLDAAAADLVRPR